MREDLYTFILDIFIVKYITYVWFCKFVLHHARKKQLRSSVLCSKKKELYYGLVIISTI